MEGNSVQRARNRYGFREWTQQWVQKRRQPAAPAQQSVSIDMQGLKEKPTQKAVPNDFIVFMADSDCSTDTSPLIHCQLFGGSNAVSCRWG